MCRKTILLKYLKFLMKFFQRSLSFDHTYTDQRAKGQ